MTFKTTWLADHDAHLRDCIVEKKMTYEDAARSTNDKFRTSYSRDAAISRGRKIGLSKSDPLPHKRPGWIDEHCAELRRLIIDKNYSYQAAATAINEMFGTTYSKNAAISCGHRLGFPKSQTHVQAQIARRPVSHALKANVAPRRPRAESPRAVLPKPLPAADERPIVAFAAPLAPADIPAGKFDLLDLTPCQCRFPFGDQPPFLFCGEVKIEGSSYCLEHTALTTNPHSYAAVHGRRAA